MANTSFAEAREFNHSSSVCDMSSNMSFKMDPEAPSTWPMARADKATCDIEPLQHSSFARRMHQASMSMRPTASLGPRAYFSSPQPSLGPPIGTVSSWGAFCSITSALLGTGLSVPYAFGQVGMVCGGLSLLFVTLIVGYGVRMVTLSLCSEKCRLTAEAENVDLRECELSFLAYCAYGHRGRVLTSLVLSAELWFALVVHLVTIGVNGSLLTHGVLSQRTVIIIATTVIFPLLDAPAWLLGFGGMCSLIGTGLCTSGFFDAAVEAWPSDPFAQPHAFQLSSVVRFISATGIFVYGYGNAACLPPIRSEMASTHRFPLVSVVALLVSFIFYGAMGIAAFPFGGSIGQNYLANVTRPTVLTVACSSVIVSFMCVMPLMTNPILLALLPVARAKSRTQILMFKVAFSVVSAAAAVFMQDYLAALSSLTGTSLTMLTIVLLPAGIYLRLVPHVRLAEKLLILMVTVFSIAFVILGTYVAVLDIFHIAALDVFPKM